MANDMRKKWEAQIRKLGTKLLSADKIVLYLENQSHQLENYWK